MTRAVAFLRGINVGGHRVVKEDLIKVFVDLGLDDVSTFLASGNVLFSHGQRPAPETVAAALEDALGYRVPTTLRSADELIAIAGREPFAADAVAHSAGKPQVILLFSSPTAGQRETVLALADDDDLLAFDGQELHWLPSGGMSESDLDVALIEKTVGPMTIRTANTITRLVAKL